jgi:hypothetical protein
MDEVLAMAVQKFFHALKTKTRSVVFLLLDDTIIQKTGKKIPGCAWYKDHAQNLANVFGHQWVLAALFYKQSVLPLAARLYHPKKVKGCGRFHTRISLAKKILKACACPWPANSMFWPITGTGVKNWPCFAGVMATI